MPTYVYKFLDTGETIEVQQAFTDPTLTEYVHPSDGNVRAVKKVFQPVGVTFKGGGFYKTDSRGGTASSGAASSTSTTATTPSSGSSDSGSSSSSTTPAPSPSTSSSSGSSTTSGATGSSSGSSSSSN